MRVELHCHSTFSDGTESVATVAGRAAERGVAVFALTDHDTCDGCDAIGDVGGARVIRAVELSCDHEGHTVHVLAYQRGDAFAPILDRLAAQRTARANRVRVMAAKLAARGVRLDIEPLIAESARRAIGRPDLARMMVAGGHATSMKDAFARHLYDRGPVDVPHTSLPLAEACDAARACDAALSIAHPHLYDAMTAAMLTRYPAIGGVEAYYGAYDARERARWIELADARGLACTGGSDWHGPQQAHTAVGIDLPDDRARALLAFLGVRE